MGERLKLSGPGPYLRRGPITVGIAAFAVALSCLAAATDRAIAAAETNATAVPIVVGLATPLSGRSGSIGAAQSRSLAEGVARLNARGGLLGRPLQHKTVDDQCSREGAERAFAELVAAGAAVVIGYPCPAATSAAAPLAAKAGVLLVTAGNRNPALPAGPKNPLLFRASGRDDAQGHDAADRLLAMAGSHGPIAILHDRTAMARAIVAQATRRIAEVRGVPDASAASVLGIVAGETDYGKAIDRIAVVPPSAIMFAGFPAEAAIILRQLRGRGLTAPLLLNTSNATDELVAHAGASLLASGVEVMLPVSATSSVAAGPYGGERLSRSPVAIAAEDTEAALLAWASSVAATGSVTPDQIARHLREPGRPNRELGFDANGDARTRSFAPFTWGEGGWRRVD